MASAAQPTAARPVRWYNYAAYGSNDILGAGSMAVISTWVLFFYTTFCGLSAAQATLIFGVARVLDAITSPTVGYISDRFGGTALGRRFGRRRFFILAAIPLLPSFAIMWVAGQSFWYYLVTYVLFEMVYAMEIIPFETLAAEMGSDYRTKAKFAGWRIMTGQISAILAAILPGRLIEHLGKDSPDTYLYMGILFAGLFMLSAALLYLFSWERPRVAEAEAARGGSLSPWAAIRELYRNLLSTLRIRAFRLHLGMYIGGYVSQDVFNAAFTYFVIFALGGTAVAVSNLAGLTYAVQTIAVLLAINYALRAAPARAYQLAAGSFAFGILLFLGLWAAGMGASGWVFILPVMFAGMGRGALNYIPWATYNYMADVDEIVTGRRREGAFAGVMTFVRKMSQAAALIGVGQILQAAGFRAGATAQAPTTVHAIVAVLGIGSLALLGFGVWVSTRFRLDPTTHAVLMDEIERLRAGERTPASPAAQGVVENLSGWRYDQLWGRNDVH